MGIFKKKEKYCVKVGEVISVDNIRDILLADRIARRLMEKYENVVIELK